jgi:hypothetical protein
VDPRAARAEAAHDLVALERRELAHGRHAERLEALRGARAHAEDLRDRQRVEDLADLVGADDAEAVGLVEVARELGEELRGRDADRRDEPGLPQDVALDAAADLDRVAEQALAAGGVEERRRSTRSGQSWSAFAVGIAERTPNFRDS